MEELKRYTSFKALKSNSGDPPKHTVFSEFETFLKRLQSEYSDKKKTNKDRGKQPDR